MRLYKFFNLLQFKIPSVCLQKYVLRPVPCKAFIITKPDWFGLVGSGQHLHGINIEHCDVFLEKIAQNVKEYLNGRIYRGPLKRNASLNSGLQRSITHSNIL